MAIQFSYVGFPMPLKSLTMSYVSMNPLKVMLPRTSKPCIAVWGIECKYFSYATNKSI